MTRRHGYGMSILGRLLFALSVLVLAAPAASDAEAAMSKEQIKAAIEKEYGVTVLRIEETKEAGRAAFRVTMMNAGGDFNDAFQVNQIVVDAESGRPIAAFRHRASGHRQSGASIENTNRQPPYVLRERTWR